MLDPLPEQQKKRRSPFCKEHFLEGTRQKWLAVGVIVLLAILYFDIRYEFEAKIYVEAIGMLLLAFILGKTGTDAMGQFKVGKVKEAQVQHGAPPVFDPPPDDGPPPFAEPLPDEDFPVPPPDQRERDTRL